MLCVFCNRRLRKESLTESHKKCMKQHDNEANEMFLSEMKEIMIEQIEAKKQHQQEILDCFENKQFGMCLMNLI